MQNEQFPVAQFSGIFNNTSFYLSLLCQNSIFYVINYCIGLWYYDISIYFLYQFLFTWHFFAFFFFFFFTFDISKKGFLFQTHSWSPLILLSFLNWERRLIYFSKFGENNKKQSILCFYKGYESIRSMQKKRRVLKKNFCLVVLWALSIKLIFLTSTMTPQFYITDRVGKMCANIQKSLMSSTAG